MFVETFIHIDCSTFEKYSNLRYKVQKQFGMVWNRQYNEYLMNLNSSKWQQNHYGSEKEDIAIRQEDKKKRVEGFLCNNKLSQSL